MQSYRICSPKVVYEILNTEVIAVDFDTGNYYAMAHVAKQIWQLIEQQIPPDQIATLLSNHYPCDFSKVLSDVHLFINELHADGLIEQCSVDLLSDPVHFPSENGEYAPPKLQRYTDVQNLLLLDPIHEVTDAGWPDKLEPAKKG